MAGSAPPQEVVDRHAGRELAGPLSANSWEGWALLVGVHDGDTIAVVLELVPGHFFRVPVRLCGVDACELRDPDPAARTLAQRARARVEELLTCSGDRMVHLSCTRRDKYGRQLAEVFPRLGGRSVSRILLDEGLAVPYSGGRRRAASAVDVATRQ